MEAKVEVKLESLLRRDLILGILGTNSDIESERSYLKLAIHDIIKSGESGEAAEFTDKVAESLSEDLVTKQMSQSRRKLNLKKCEEIVSRMVRSKRKRIEPFVERIVLCRYDNCQHVIDTMVILTERAYNCQVPDIMTWLAISNALNYMGIDNKLYPVVTLTRCKIPIGDGWHIETWYNVGFVIKINGKKYYQRTKFNNSLTVEIVEKGYNLKHVIEEMYEILSLRDIPIRHRCDLKYQIPEYMSTAESVCITLGRECDCNFGKNILAILPFGYTVFNYTVAVGGLDKFMPDAKFRFAEDSVSVNDITKKLLTETFANLFK